jgi:hypothetical protein
MLKIRPYSAAALLALLLLAAAALPAARAVDSTDVVVSGPVAVDGTVIMDGTTLDSAATDDVLGSLTGADSDSSTGETPAAGVGAAAITIAEADEAVKTGNSIVDPCDYVGATVKVTDVYGNDTAGALISIVADNIITAVAIIRLAFLEPLVPFASLSISFFHS